MSMLEHHTLMKVLLPAGNIPNGALITKRTGTAQYRLHRGLRFYATKEAKDKLGEATRTVDARDGCIFLVDEEKGTVNVYPCTTQFMWLVRADSLERHLNHELHPEDCK